MARLKTLQPRVKVAAQRQLSSIAGSERRITGRKLQERRFAIWQRDPRCAKCARLVTFPDGFELDHIVPLHKGGEDTEGNCQVLCIVLQMIGGKLVKTGCHASKTVDDLRQ